MADTNAELAAKLREADEKATAGPWSAADEHGLLPGASPAWCISRMREGFEAMSEADVDDRGRLGGYLYDVAEIVHDDERTEHDAEMIVLLRNNLPQIIAALEATEGKVTSRRRECVGCAWCCQSTPAEKRGRGHRGCAS